MGEVYSNYVEEAGSYLLSILAIEGAVTYSRFYDGTDETQQKLLAGMGYPKQNEEDYEPECPELCMDLAVGQLEDKGIVKTRELSDKLADDEPNYEIALTDLGRQFIERKDRIEYRDVDL